MLTRVIPSSHEAIPVVGMGTWQTFDPPSLDERSLAPLADVMRAFYDAGGRVIDSSPMYGNSERVTGLVSARLKVGASLFIATKVWAQGERAGIRQMETSLAELERRHVDLMQVHNLVDWRVHLETLRRWKTEGRTRYIGVTHYQRSAFDELERIMRREHVDFVQVPYSIGMRAAEQRLLPTASETGTAVLVNRPFEEGALLRSLSGRAIPDFLAPFASSWAEALLKFIIAHPAVTCVIPATANARHMAEDVAAGSGRQLDDVTRERLARYVA